MPTYKVGRLNNQRAFTLIELSIVIFLLSLMAVISVPLLSSFGDNHLNLSVRRISGMVKYVYNEAALTATTQRLTFDIDQGSCVPQQQSANGEWQALNTTVRRYQLPADVKISEIWIDGKGKVIDGTATIDFSPQGWLPATTIHLQRGERQLSLHLLSLTGTTEVEEGYHEFN